MKRVFLSLIGLLFACSFLLAKQIDVRTAQTVAQTFLSGATSLRSTSSLDLVYTCKDEGFLRNGQSENYYYVFNIGNNQGFVIISADDVNVPVIGYSTEGYYDPDNLPDNFKGWMEGVAESTKRAISENASAKAVVVQEWSDYQSGRFPATLRSATAVAPLIKTKWNQGSPYQSDPNHMFYDPTDIYNEAIPIRTESGFIPYTGCVATAMAQVMKYHEHPRSGLKATEAYTTSTHGYSVPSIDLTKVVYDWANMLNSYDRNSTKTQINAVTQLMYHCGAALQMNYSTGGSSSADFLIPKALVEFYDYHHSVHFIMKDDSSDTEWVNAIKKELTAKRPIVYGGSGTGGHSFICDGYDVTDLFHFNWGWGGQYDGYFNINALTPGSHDYTKWHTMVIGIKPNTGTHGPSLILSRTPSTPSVIEVGRSFYTIVNMKNASNAKFEGYYAVALTDVAGNIKHIVNQEQSNTPIEIEVDSEYDMYETCSIPADVIPGTYYIRIFQKEKGTSVWELINHQSANNYNYTKITVQAATCAAPSGLSSTSITNTGATVSWNAVSGAQSYTLQYKKSTEGTWTTASSSLTATSYNLSGLSASTAYNWQVRTNCSASNSSAYTQGNFTTLLAAPLGLSSSNISSSGATVSWNAVSGAQSYTLQYKKSTESTWTTVSSSLTATSYNLSGLSASTVYNWQVRANGASSVSSAYTQSSFSTSAVITSPVGLSSSNTSSSGATVSWSAVSGAQSYTLQYKKSAESTWTTVSSSLTATSYNLSGLSASTIYNWQVRANGASSVSSAYAQSSFTTLLTAPAGLAVSNISSSGATVSWSAVSGAQSYTLQYKKSAESTWTTASSSLTATSYNLSGLSASTVYNWQIRANGASSVSSVYVQHSFSTSAAVTKVSYEFEDMENRIYSGQIQKQMLANFLQWSNDAQSWWHSGAVNHPVEYYFNMSIGGSYDAELQFTQATDYSIFDVYINDEFSTTIDGYNSALSVRKIRLKGGKYIKGSNKISFVLRGKNARASNQSKHMIGLDCITIDYAGTSAGKIEQAYIIGSAVTGVGWDLSKAELLANDNSGANKLVWEGLLEKGEFKFVQNTQSWAPSVNPYGTYTISDGGTYNLQPTNAIQDDYKFVVNEKGYYRITLTTTTMSMTVAEKPLSYPVYLIGDATPAGWNNTNPIEMEISGSKGDTRVWSGYLKKGHYKFILKPGTWISLVPDQKAHEDVIVNYPHRLSDNYQGDYRFVVTREGNYKISVYLGDDSYSMNVEAVDGYLPPIYLVGDATPTGWNNTNPTVMNSEVGGTYRWRGTLKKGYFKFITELGTWKSLVPQNTAHQQMDVPNGKAAISNIYRGDYKFLLPEDGLYEIELSMNEGVFYCTQLSSTFSLLPTGDSQNGLFTVVGGDGYVLVKLKDITSVEKVELISLAGQLVDAKQKVSGDVILGNDLTSNVYIVRIIYGDTQIYTQKVQVK